MSLKKPGALADWLPANPDLLEWDSITGLTLSAGNAALRRTHASHLSQEHEIAGISGSLAVDMSQVVYHFAGYQLSGPQIAISRVAYEGVRLDVTATLHGGTLVQTNTGYKVMSLSEHDPLEGIELRQQVKAQLKEGALVLDLSKGEDMRLAVTTDASVQAQAGEWLRGQLPQEAGKVDYVLFAGRQDEPAYTLKDAILGTQANAQDIGDTLVIFASSQYGRSGNLPNANGLPRLLPEVPQANAVMQLISPRLMHRNAFLAGFLQLPEDGHFTPQFEDGRLTQMVADEGTLRVPSTTYVSSDFTFTSELFYLNAVGGLGATFELDQATQRWTSRCTVPFSCVARDSEVATEYTADFALSLSHRFYLLPSQETDHAWLEGQFFSPWPDAQEAQVLRGLPEGEASEALRSQAQDFVAHVVKRALLLAIAPHLDSKAPENWLGALTFGAAHTLQPEADGLKVPNALSVPGVLNQNADFVVHDDSVLLVAGSTHSFSVENPGNQTLTWTLESLPGGPTHPGTCVDGTYRAPPAHTLQRRSGQVLVIAANEAGQRSVAVVTVLRQALTANPFITVMQAGTQRELSAGVLDDASLVDQPLRWTMSNHDPERSGELVEQAHGRRCIYKARAVDPNQSATYWLESVEVALQAPAATQPVHVLVTQREPGLVVALADEASADGTLQFVAYANGRVVPATWELAIGTGQIDANSGLYEPAQSGPQTPGILVFATFDAGDFGVFEGHQIMPLQAQRFTHLSRQLLKPQARTA